MDETENEDFEVRFAFIREFKILATGYRLRLEYFCSSVYITEQDLHICIQTHSK